MGPDWREGYVLGPATYNVKKWSVFGKPSYLLNSDQIKQLTEDVAVYSQTIPWWNNRLSQLAGRVGSSRE
jgi:hypothetical protein